MDSTTSMNVPGTYDPRWFIWTIVFLVVTGISLVSYIVLSDTSGEIDTRVPVKAPLHQAAKPASNVIKNN